jgi:hypothetical protein
LQPTLATYLKRNDGSGLQTTEVRTEPLIKNLNKNGISLLNAQLTTLNVRPPRGVDCGG